MHDPAEDFDWALLAKYLAGECAAAEAVEVERWIAADPARSALVDELRRAWQRTTELPDLLEPVDVDAARRRAAARIRTHAATRPPRPFTVESMAGGRSRWLTQAAGIAAVLVGVMGMGLVWRQYIAANERSRVSVAPAPFREYSTPRAQRGTVQLLDGTRLVLGPASRLRLSRQFGVTREVYLEGEAFFQVAHDSTRPFIVHAANAVTRVLGTEFSVRAYPDDREVEVVVKTGKVALRRSSSLPADAATSLGAILTKGQLGRVGFGGPATVMKEVDLDRLLGWTEGRLVFHRTPLREAVAQIQRWYDLEIHLASPALAANAVTASFAPGEPASEVLHVVAEALNLEAVPTGARTYMLRAKD